MRLSRAATLILAVAAISISVPALRAEEPVPPPKPAAPAAPAAPAPDDAKALKDAKVRKFLEVSRWKDLLVATLDASFDQQVAMGRIPKGFSKKFKEVADFKSLEDLAVEVWGTALDDATLDAAIAFHGSEAGKKFAEASMHTVAAMNEKMMPWAMEQGGKTMQALLEAGPEEGADEEDGGILKNLKAAKRSANETAAIATLRNLTAGQAMIQGSGKIDADEDGIGEHGTFLELTGSVGVRKGQDFSSQGTKVVPPVMAKALSAVGPDGVVRKSGYCFRIFLPDTEKQAGFLHETGPAEKVGLSGGTGKVGVDIAETTWCAYAWPDKLGDTGTRVFFVNQAGDVLQSANQKAQWAGEKGPPGNAAFRGAGITSQIAVGTAGQDGDVWKVTN